VKDRFELCEEHEDTKVYYDYRLKCPLCNAAEEIENLKKKIGDLEEEE
jgi:hypothetical protein